MQTQASPPIVIPVSKPCINAANIAYLCKKVYKNEKIYKIINTVIGNPDDNQRLLPAHLPRPAWHCDAGAHRDSRETCKGYRRNYPAAGLNLNGHYGHNLNSNNTCSHIHGHGERRSVDTYAAFQSLLQTRGGNRV